MWVAEGRGRDQWAHTSTILAMIANANRDPKHSRAYVPDDFNPHVDQARQVSGDIREFKRMCKGMRR